MAKRKMQRLLKVPLTQIKSWFISTFFTVRLGKGEGRVNTLKSFSFCPVGGSTTQVSILLLLSAPRVAALEVYQEYSLILKAKRKLLLLFWLKKYRNFTPWQIIVPRINEFQSQERLWRSYHSATSVRDKEADRDVRDSLKVIPQISGKRPFESLCSALLSAWLESNLE